MADYLVTVSHDALNGANQDTAVNNFAFRAAGPLSAADRLDVFNAIATFYNGLTGAQVRTVSSYMSSTLDRSSGASRLKMYELTGLLQAVVPEGAPEGTKPRPPAHGSPIDESGFTLTAAFEADSLPSQVACAVTLRGRDALAQAVEGPGDVRPRARRTGRIYIGPLNLSASTTGANVRPSTQFRDDLLIAAEGLQDNLVDAAYVWSIWSRSAGAMYGIERAEVDDSFDVIRSRKLPPTTRSVRTFVPEPAVVLGA